MAWTLMHRTFGGLRRRLEERREARALRALGRQAPPRIGAESSLSERRAFFAAHQERPLYFLHIPKTAGYSLRQHLVAAFPERPAVPWLDWDQYFLGEGGVPRSSLVSGHFGVLLSDELDLSLHTVTFLRDPVARTLSHYRYVRSVTEHPFHEIARSQTPKEFVEDPRTRPMVENWQARYLAPRQRGIRELRKDLSDEGLRGHVLQTRFELEPVGLPDEVSLLEAARETLSGCLFVGVTERFRLSLAGLFFVLCRETPERIVHGNRSTEGEEASVPPDLRARIEALTEVDRMLYEEVNERLGTQLEAAGLERGPWGEEGSGS